MNELSDDRRVYESLQPVQVAAYLNSRGWRRTDQIRNLASVWSPDEKRYYNAEVILPFDKSVGDFVIRMAELVRALGTIEQRPVREILNDISQSTSDVVRLAFGGETYDDGTMPLETGARLIGRAWDAVAAVASVTVVRQPIAPPRRPDQAREFLRRVRLGQTERGSYILIVQSPVLPALNFQGELIPAPDDSQAAPFERRVMVTFARALEATQQAYAEASTTRSMDKFWDGVQEGVSANLCEAVSGMLEDPETRGLTARFTWSPARPAPPDAPSLVTFDREAGEVIREASRLLRERTTESDVEVEGEVIGLLRPKGLEGGKVTIESTLDGRTRLIQIELNVTEYLDAIEAHKDRTVVRCRGELIYRGGRYHLVNPVSFQIL